MGTNPELIKQATSTSALPRVPIAPDATESAVVGPRYHKVIYEEQDVRASGR
jgi:hypothetical protein